MNTGILYIVATPIGNMQDISLRAVQTLQSVDCIACEDTRRTGLLWESIQKLLSSSSRREGKPKFVSYYEQNELQRIPEIIALLQKGENIVLVSDAGTPLVSDPGYKLVRECLQSGIKVESIPGASSVISALVSSGMPSDKFLFVGYLPKKEGKKKNFFASIKVTLEASKDVNPTVIFFESPFRVVKSLETLQEVFGDIDIAVCRELTKLHEEVRRELVSTAIEHFTKTNPKGEFVILFHLEK